MNNVTTVSNVEITYPAENFTLNDAVTLNPTVSNAKVVIRAKVSEAIRQGTMRVVGKTTRGKRGRPSLVYSKV